MEISESAWAKAKEIVSEMGHSEWWDEYQEVAEAIARAMDQERRECAEIAQDQYDFHMTVDGDNRAAAAADLIFQAIRNR